MKLMFYASSSVMNVSGARGDIYSITTARRLPRKTKTGVTYATKTVVYAEVECRLPKRESQKKLVWPGVMAKWIKSLLHRSEA